MIQRIQSLGTLNRVLIYALFLVGGLLFLLAVTAFLALEAINSSPREMAKPVLNGVSVQEFAVLPDEDAYPATIASAPDGTLYTGSYATGVVWSITPEGIVTELPNTRDLIGSVTALTVAPDGTLYVLDRLESDPRSAGGIIWRIDSRGFVVEYGSGINSTVDFIAPDDLTTDSAGNIYATDRGHRQVWKFDGGEFGTVWWSVPPDDESAEDVIPTGLAYDATNDAILITDSEANTVYRVPVAGGDGEILFRYTQEEDLPSFDGITAAPDGSIYIAALSQRQVFELRDGELIVLAEGFRGASDVEYSSGRLYVTNFDQRSLVLPGIQPQLPFALDVVTLPQDD